MRRDLLVFVTAFALSSCAAAAYAPTLGSEAVTLDEYNQLANGMTLEQVSEVIGSDGTQIASSSLGGDQMEPGPPRSTRRPRTRPAHLHRWLAALRHAAPGALERRRWRQRARSAVVPQATARTADDPIDLGDGVTGTFLFADEQFVDVSDDALRGWDGRRYVCVGFRVDHTASWGSPATPRCRS
jgi:hypothetical protein